MTLILPDPYFTDLRTHLCLWEGRIPWLYLDGPGHVTVGVGHLLPDFATAQSVVPGLTQAEWDAVISAPPNQPASAYKRLTTARMSEDSMDGVLDTDIYLAGQQLATALPDAQGWPVPVRQALFDFGFNIGSAGLVKKFPKMLAAMRAADWKTAALESARTDVESARNDYAYSLIMSASSGLA